METKFKRIKRGRIIEGTADVCCHRVVWWFGIPSGLRLTDEEKANLMDDCEREAEDRAKDCIVEGCGSGQLCALYTDTHDKQHEMYGWFDIDRS